MGMAMDVDVNNNYTAVVRRRRVERRRQCDYMRRYNQLARTKRGVKDGCVRRLLNKGDARQRRTTTGYGTTSRQTRGEREERRPRTRGDGASMGIEKRRQSQEDKRQRHQHYNQPANERLLRRLRKRRRRRWRWRWRREMPRAAITGIWRRLPWSSRLRLRPRSLRMMLMVATAVSPLSAGHLLRRGAG